MIRRMRTLLHLLRHLTRLLTLEADLLDVQYAEHIVQHDRSKDVECNVSPEDTKVSPAIVPADSDTTEILVGGAQRAHLASSHGVGVGELCAGCAEVGREVCAACFSGWWVEDRQLA